MLPLGILLAVAGVLLAVLLPPMAGKMVSAAGGMVAAGIIADVAGAACTLAGVLAGRKGSNTASPEFPFEFEELRRAIEEDEAYIADTDKIVTDYVTAHGKNFNEETVTVVLQGITGESMEYISLKKKYQRSFDSTKTEELEGLRHFLHDFLGRYGIQSADARFGDDLYILRGRAENIRRSWTGTGIDIKPPVKVRYQGELEVGCLVAVIPVYYWRGRLSGHSRVRCHFGVENVSFGSFQLGGKGFCDKMYSSFLHRIFVPLTRHGGKYEAGRPDLMWRNRS